MDQCQDIELFVVGEGHKFGHFNSLQCAATFQRITAARIVHKNPPHCLRGRREEMAAWWFCIAVVATQGAWRRQG